MSQPPIYGDETPIERPFKRFLRLLGLDRSDIASIIVYSVFSGLITLTIPLGVQAIINFIALGQISTSWVVLTFIIALATAIAGAMRVMQLIITENIQVKLFTRSAFEFAYRMPKFRLSKLKDQYAPELANRFFDTLSIQKGLPKIVMDFSDSVLQIFFGLALLALYHPFFVAFGIVLIILLVSVILTTAPAGLRTALKESKYKYKTAYWLEELGRTMNSFKLAGKTQYPMEKTDELVEGYTGFRRKHFRIIRIQLISVVTMKTIATAALLLIGGWLVIVNEINIGQFVASEIMIIIVLNSLEKIMLSMETIFDVLTSVEKIGAVMDVELENNQGEDFERFKKHGQGMEIEIRNLNFKPESNQRSVLQDINLHIPSGQKLAIVGFNASGKTTLLKIILGLYDDYQGSVLYNGIPKGNINTQSLRSYMGDYISEEYLFNGTIAKNISMGRKNVSLENIVKVCEDINLMPFIQSLPQGLNTMIPSDGEGLPQNVLRKIILARCIVDQPLLIATEPLLNNMENQDKSKIIKALTNRQNPWTLIAITNNSQMARRCDQIIVLDKGQIIFQGQFPELQQQPYFHNLFDDVFVCEENS